MVVCVRIAIYLSILILRKIEHTFHRETMEKSRRIFLRLFVFSLFYS